MDTVFPRMLDRHLFDDLYLFSGHRNRPSTKIHIQRMHFGGVDGEAYISDSDDDGTSDTERDNADLLREQRLMLRNAPHHHRLDPGAFEWLQDWCSENAVRIEAQRKREREANQPELRRLYYDLRDADDEIRNLGKALKEKKKEKQRIKRQMLVLADEEALISTTPGSLDLEAKLFTFCKTMGEPYCSEFGRYPSMKGFMKNERELLRTTHQVMSAMRVLHEDLVDAPKRADKKFKPRNPHPSKWQILQRSYESDEAAPGLLTTETDLRMACMALQNLYYSWQEGYI